jgi:hypothetical protein
VIVPITVLLLLVKILVAKVTHHFPIPVPMAAAEPEPSINENAVILLPLWYNCLPKSQCQHIFRTLPLSNWYAARAGLEPLPYHDEMSALQQYYNC